MDPTLKARLQPELAAGERLIWAGRPNTLRLAWLRGGKLAAFAIPWTLFACVWTGLAWLFAGGNEDGEMFGRLAMLIGPVFILFGVYLFVSSLVQAVRVFGTIYGLTDRRALILKGGGELRSYGAEDLVSLHRRGFKRGDLIFRDAVPRAAGDPTARSGTFTDYGFFGIADPRGVERLIRERITRP